MSKQPIRIEGRGDLTLVELYRKSFSELCRRADDTLRGIAIASDVVEEAFILLLARKSRPRGEQSPRQWLEDRIALAVERFVTRFEHVWRRGQVRRADSRRDRDALREAYLEERAEERRRMRQRAIQSLRS